MRERKINHLFFIHKHEVYIYENFHGAYDYYKRTNIFIKTNFWPKIITRPFAGGMKYATEMRNVNLTE